MKQEIRISPKEAEYIVLSWVLTFATLCEDPREDFHSFYPDNYMLDPSKATDVAHYEFSGNCLVPNDAEIQIIAAEARKVVAMLMKRRETLKARYSGT